MSGSANLASTEPSIPWRRIGRWFLLSRLFIFAAAGVSLHFVPAGPFFAAPASPLDWLKHWDAQWFVEIAEHGYTFSRDHASSVNFLPLYPLLIRVASFLTGNETVAGYLVSNLACLVAAGQLWQLAYENRTSERGANFAALFFLCGPVAFFFATIYSEATFACCALVAILAARQGRWRRAGLWSAAATLARSAGVVLIVPLALEFVQRHWSRKTWRALQTWRQFLWCAAPAFALGLYVAFLAWRFGEPRAYFISQHYSGHGFSYVWDIFVSRHFAAIGPFYRAWFGGAALVGVLLLFAGALLRQPLPLTSWALAACVMHFSIKTLEAMPRYMALALPFYCTLGEVGARWPLVGRILLVASLALLAISVSLFTNGYWFT